MMKENIPNIQTCDLKVHINCDGCAKKIKKIMDKIDGVYETKVNKQQGKVTVTGLMDIDTVFKKLKKVGMSAQLWDANPTSVSKHQNLQLGCSDDRGDLLKDSGGKVLPQGEARSSNGCGARSGGGTNDATMVLPQLTPTPQQLLPNLQQQIEQRLQMLNGEKLPPHQMGMPPAINRGGKKSGKKICGGTKVLVPGNANSDNKNDVGMELHQDAAGGSQVKNSAIGQPSDNSALGSLNNHSQAEKDTIVVGDQTMGSSSMVPQKEGMMRPNKNMISTTSFPVMGQMGGSMVPQKGGMMRPNSNMIGSTSFHAMGQMGGNMVPQKGGMMRPNNNMIDPSSFPILGQTSGVSMVPYTHMDGYNMQQYGGGLGHGPGMTASNLHGDGFYPRGAGSNGPEMIQQVPRIPMLQQPYMMVQPQQEHQMLMSAHFPHSQNAQYGPAWSGYQLMGYDNGHGNLQQQYPPPTYYPMPLPPQPDNIFSEENPNICSLM